jgi:hypothetical protein
MQLWQKCIAMHIHVLGTGKFISKSGFFPCLLLSAERQALLGPVISISAINSNTVIYILLQEVAITM